MLADRVGDDEEPPYGRDEREEDLGCMLKLPILWWLNTYKQTVVLRQPTSMLRTMLASMSARCGHSDVFEWRVSRGKSR